MTAFGRRAAIDGAVFLLRRRPVARAAGFFNSLLKELFWIISIYAIPAR
jgi:hypothetical protein